MYKALDGHKTGETEGRETAFSSGGAGLVEVLDWCLYMFPEVELNIEPSKALQAVDWTGQLWPHGCGCCSFPFINKHERRLNFGNISVC